MCFYTFQVPLTLPQPVLSEREVSVSVDVRACQILSAID